MIHPRLIRFLAPEINPIHSIKDALNETGNQKEAEVFIIGGADIYRQTIVLADKIYRTHIHHAFDGDAFFQKST